MTAVTMASFDATLSRVRLDMTAVRTALGHDGTGLVERSTDQVRWTTVRGGSAVPLTTSAADVDDYEFVPDVQNFYRVTPATGSYTDSITPDLEGSAWLKNIRYPFLNMPVVLSDASDITRAARSSTFDVVGRTFPVAVATTRAGRSYSITVATDTDDDSAALAALLADGGTILVQVPADYTMPLTGYYSVGDTSETRNAVNWSRRWTELPLTEVAAPGPDITGTTITWQGVLDAYATWAALLTAEATWQDVVESVGTPADVMVS